MKLLFFHYSMQSGGAERTIALLSDYVSRQGDSVTIVTMDKSSSFYSLHPAVTHIPLDIGGNSQSLRQAVTSNFRSLRSIKSIYHQIQPDAVVCFGPNTILLSFLARGRMKYKLIGSERANPYVSVSSFWSKSKRVISTLCNGYLFQTAGAQGYYPAMIREKSIILTNSIVTSDFVEHDLSWEERNHICAVGRMDAGKCFGDLLVAFAQVHNKYVAVKLDLYGDGPMREALELQAKDLGLEKFVVFHGRCKTMLSEYAKHKIFVMTSSQEGMPNVLMEALASGCACVSTNCNFGPSELIQDGENGFLVSVHDIDAIADRICRLLKDDNLCRSFSKSAQSIRETHDIEVIGAKFRSYLNKI